MRDLSSFVDPLIKAYRVGGAFTPGADIPSTVAEAYAVHAALMASFGPAGGFKISQKPGNVPVVAPIPESRCLPSGASVEVPARVGVELEVGFEIVAPLPDIDDPHFREWLVASVRPVPMIELVASRLEGPIANDPVAKLADLQANEALVFGDALSDWRGSDFGETDVSMVCTERAIHRGPASVPGGSALSALEATVRILGSGKDGLRIGHRILTGTLTPLTWISSGQTVKGQIAGLGAVSVDLLSRAEGRPD